MLFKTAPRKHFERVSLPIFTEKFDLRAIFDLRGFQKGTLSHYISAQKKANAGHIVIAGMTQDDRVNGHIGVVRPYRNVDYDVIARRGPIVMASSSPNTYASYLDDEFRLNDKRFAHIAGRIAFYYNDIISE